MQGTSALPIPLPETALSQSAGSRQPAPVESSLFSHRAAVGRQRRRPWHAQCAKARKSLPSGLWRIFF